ncbi:MAG: hydroxymethylbilane synthase [Ferroplasma sp.]
MPLILGTRNSKLAMIQANMVKQRLEALGKDVEIRPFVSSGDLNKKIPLYKMSSTGVFVDELNTKIINGEIDIAVHSSKDIPSYIDEKLEISAVLKRDDYRDVLISHKPLSEMGGEESIGTSSMRRIMELHTVNPDVQVKDIRGNIDTRLLKYMRRNFDGIIMAKAAYDRMKLDTEHYVLEEDQFVPSPNQGIIAIVSRKDSEISGLMKEINDKDTYEDMELERCLVNELKLGCSMPVGILSHNKQLLARFYSLKSGEYADFHFTIFNKAEIINTVKKAIKNYGYADR